MKQASVVMSYENLVEICKPIPVIDKNLDTKITGKQYRKVTKPINVGGDIDDALSLPLKEEAYPNVTSTNVTSTNIMPKTEIQLGGEKLKNKPIKKYNIRLV